jgi:hypothetical protein
MLLHTLSLSETQQPVQVFDELFDFAHLPEIRDMLWLWLKTTVCGSFHQTLSRTEKENLIALYEKMQKLVEAAWLVQQQGSKKVPVAGRGNNS